ncbi:MAG: formylglycine-generating enzyme family protein [Spirochaetaceae bacterium]|nr:formylglycine-generating enzyme family protein [Spirochaetaceae bacterium]
MPGAIACEAAGIRDAFAVGVREVTFAEWDACVSAGGCGGYRPPDGGWGRARQPVINVSWDDAQSYVAWLSRKTGAEYRLLTEAEWEYAARAGTTTPFHTGATIATGQANYDGRAQPYGPGVPGPYRGHPIAAGSLARNGFGLYDVHGNVAEMVADCYDAGGSGSSCTRRVVRGGSWASAPRLLRSAYRSWCAPPSAPPKPASASPATCRRSGESCHTRRSDRLRHTAHATESFPSSTVTRPRVPRVGGCCHGGR